MSREDFEGIKELAKKNHADRVAKNPDRIAYAIEQFEKHGIEYSLKNAQIGHFHCRRKSDDKLFQFYAGTGKIQNEKRKRGIHALIRILDDIKSQPRGSVSLTNGHIDSSLCCETCNYYDNDRNDQPCCSCNDFNNWKTVSCEDKISKGDICVYYYAEGNGSLNIVEIAEVIDDTKSRIKCVQVIIDNSGNEWFKYMRKTGTEMTASNTYLYKVDCVSTLKAVINELTLRCEKLCYKVDYYRNYDKERDIALHSSLIENTKAETLKEVVQQLEAEIESSDKYIREYEDSAEQRAFNQGLRKALDSIRGTANEG